MKLVDILKTYAGKFEIYENDALKYSGETEEEYRQLPYMYASNRTIDFISVCNDTLEIYVF